MNDEIVETNDRQEEKTGIEAAASGRVPVRLEQLYAQAEAVKMANLRSLLQSQGREGEGPEGSPKSSQAALKAIEVQLRILGEAAKFVQPPEPSLYVAEIWEALLRLKGVGPLLHREAYRTRLLELLKKKGAGDRG